MPTAYIVTDTLGVVALDEEGNIIDKVLYEGPDQVIAQKLTSIEKGEPIPEIIKLVESVKSKGYNVLVLEHKELARNLASMFKDVEIRAEIPSKGGDMFREYFENRYMKEMYGIENFWDYYKRVFDITVLQTRLKLRKVAEKRDLFIANAISAVDDCDKMMNLMASRLREWYGLHFPELEELVRDHRDYVKLLYELGHRSNFTVENIKKVLPNISEERARKIAEAAEKSVGAEMAEFDLEAIRAYAKIFITAMEARKKLAEYIDEAMKEVAPNIRELVGSLLGARLINLAGGLLKLALLPASTIQVLGAEKALFRALRTGGKPPKHGVIFQFPEIFRAPRWQRGKIARALAAKLAIAAKADAFTGNFIAPKLKEELMKRIQEIKTLYAKPPPRKPEAKARPKPAPAKREGRGGPPPPPPSRGERKPAPKR
ncbi:MAG: C/D box methylation guide ribonucleoprotein complex aNOP56 subunit [Crenarchaeota archaeon]|nr:C/D box methylation guide ribonucleoprotein complex aNOP56 subunit [Thermoproteota archaeon]